MWLRCSFSIGLLACSLVTAQAKWQNVAQEWEGISPVDKRWFSSVKSPRGVPCCDVADGHRTTFEWRNDDEGGHFWVPIQGEMVKVPKEAIVGNTGNPFDTSVVWYVGQGVDADLKQIWFIRCFVPIGGV
jgi:hypothetical protein